jgi:hypothetical protein
VGQAFTGGRLRQCCSESPSGVMPVNSKCSQDDEILFSWRNHPSFEILVESLDDLEIVKLSYSIRKNIAIQVLPDKVHSAVTEHDRCSSGANVRCLPPSSAPTREGNPCSRPLWRLADSLCEIRTGTTSPEEVCWHMSGLR